MQKKNKGKHILPAAIECNLKIGESHILEYVELTDEEYDERIIQPAARIFYDLLKRDIESGRFNEIMKEYYEKE